MELVNIELPKLILTPEVLLHPQIPKPMHGIAPRVILGRPWWNKTRKEAYSSSYYHCISCGTHKDNAKGRQWLEGHEIYNIEYAKGRMTYLKTIPLCHFCHNYIHKGRLDYLLSIGKIHQAKYIAIIQHGDEILAKANLVKPDHYKGYSPKWEDWRLVLFYKEYPPLFASYEQLLEHYEKERNEGEE